MEYSFAPLGPTLRIVVLIFMLVFALLALALVVLLAALPGQIAKRRSHPQAAAINICGWLGLPTGVLWVLALAYAYWRTDGTVEASGAAENALMAKLATQIDGLEKSILALEAKSKRSNG